MGRLLFLRLMTTISILGCGWLGLHLAPVFQQQGMQVKGSTTSKEKITVLAERNITPFLLRFPATDAIPLSDFLRCDVLIIAIPPKARQGMGNEYLQTITQIADALQQYQVSQVILISSTSVYGKVNGTVTEQTTPMPDTISGHIMLEAETLLRNCNGFTTTVIRFAGLTGPGRHPGHFLAGKQQVADGLAPVNLIHAADCAGICLAILQKQAFGYTYNACSPCHPTKQDFYTRAAIDGGFEPPTFVQEGSDGKLVTSLYLNKVLDYRFIKENCF